MGTEFLPPLLAWTSLDSSLATNYGRRINETVCDNTLHAACTFPGRRRSTRPSGRVAEVRQALDIVYNAADDFAAEVAQLCSVPVSERQWGKVLDLLVPTTGKEPGRSLTIAENKRTKIDSLYRHDERCKPWKGSKFGVIQTFNTFLFHEATIRNTHGGARPERNQLRVLSGQAGALDHWVAAVVDQVVAV